MKANELADELQELDSKLHLITLFKAATMLRKQQTEIDELKVTIGKITISSNLTDEEIMVLYEEYIETQYASESNVLGFGKAILRKAQEK